MPEFVTLRAAARLVTEQSLLMAHDGKAIAAVENERLGFQIAAQSDSPPKLIISYLAANSIEGIALAGLRQILTLSHGDGAAAAAATQSIPPNLMGDHEMWNRIMDANGMYLLRAMRRAIGAADQPYAIATPVLRQINADAETNAKQSEHLMAVILMPNFESLPHTGATRENSARVTLAGAAVLQYRAKQGKFPERLESLPALVNANAFDGQPLLYTPTSTGFHISAPQPTKPGDKPKGVTFDFP